MTHTLSRTLCATAALALMSACGGGGGGLGSVGGGGVANAADRLSYTEIAKVASDVNEGYNSVRRTPKAQVPTAGRADYYGAVGGDLTVGTQSTTVGAVMGLGVDFAANRIGGRIGNFVTEDGTDLTGTLGITNGRIDRVSDSKNAILSADVDGVLQARGNQRVVVDAGLRNGTFKGPDVRYIEADVIGGAAVNGQPGTLDMRAQLKR